ncbi:hypothetical protein LAZ67_19002108 [Cordylochernes scorpioides]|uniref:Mos1 transposase HTH domain-containing protein n=1 Tax=Cordylochernes scorpioides TaxID=51811 RepID=A0ABY6LJ65_9ARAC|nr:hypothetical protein LAZ67_19002108 [Cordylochernes scorpioides]
MEQNLKQRICIEFCVKHQISATETFEMLNKAFPNDAPKRTTVFEWHSRFKAGRISIEDDPRQGRPKFQRTDENVQKITDLIKENPRTTLLELEQDTGISKTTIGKIVTENLKLKKTPAKFIPSFLTNEQKLCRLATCEDMMEMTRTDPEWKDKIITGDETWVYGYDPETKPQTAEWRGQTVIKEMYLGILRRLREAIRKNRPEKWTNGGWILHHDNARPHTAHLMTSFLAKNGTQILLQPPYFPDIAPNDFFLFPKLKAVLKGRHFDTRDDIIEKSPLALKSIPKEAYKNCFDNWEKRWRCISEAKIKEGIFVGPQIRELQQDGNFQNSLNEVEAAAWNSFRNVCKNFLGSVKVENYRDIVNDLLLSYKALGCNMSLKIHFLHSHLDFFPDNLGAVSDEHGERFHQAISSMEKRYQGKWSPAMLADDCWALKRDLPQAKYRIKSTVTAFQ